MFVSAIIAAGGRGLRFGAPLPKQLLTIDGRSVLERSVALFLAHPEIDEVVVALPAELVAEPPAYLRDPRKPIRLVAGGARRQDSVLNAFRAVANESEFIVIHDAARPLATAGLISRTIAAAIESGAALAAMPARDTVKRATTQTPPFVDETIPRDVVYLAQTPQVFARTVLRDALALGEQGADATDEATLAERAGYAVRLVEGEATNVKITTPEDLPVMDAIARAAADDARTGLARQAGEAGQTVTRVGTGYDLHRLVEGRPLILGGVTVPFERGPLGHSDGDVVCHAATDAVLGAAALGDIGRHFPDTDPQWKDANSVELLRRAVALVRASGYDVVNVDVTVILERPKIKSYVDEMREAIAAAMGIGVAQVSIKGKTNEGVDAVGRGEAIAAHATALLVRA
ncbi:MAG: 2-C-methyl-D-erythritol 4-phosphate cytidylyltransferase [Vicinamibacterales bacterium]